MSKQEKKMSDAMRIFEALSGVDEELLIRCEEKETKVRPLWYYGKVLAACLCFVVMGALLWSVRPVMDTASKSAGSVEMEPAAAAEAPEAAKEEAACESGTAPEEDSGLKDVVTESRIEEDESFRQEAAKQESAKSESALQDAAINSQQAAIQDLQGSLESVSADVTGGAPLDKRKELTLKEAEKVDVLGEYVPTVIPAGYVFEGAWLTEDSTSQKAERISLCWVNGMDDISITISFAADVKTVDVAKTEAYDVHQYEIPYASTVPKEYRDIFNNPVFSEKDFSQKIVEMRMKVVADAGDTDTPGGKFAVLYENGILVEFNGDGDVESIYMMLDSVR